MSVNFYSRVETPRCGHCGLTGEVEISNSGLARWHSGVLIQEALPDISKETREQLISGTHPECWAEMFG